MGVVIKTKKNGFPKMRQTAFQLKGKKVNVGVLGEQAWLAGIHEYGCHIPVTPKMRAFLHYQGIHIKADTTEIVIPERSFLRAGFDQSEETILDYIDQTVGAAIDGSLPADEFLKGLGLLLVSCIRDYARDLEDPPNSDYTVEQKGSSNPLVDTGDMIGAISYEIEG